LTVAQTSKLEGQRMFVQGRIPSQWLVEQMPEAIWATDGALRFVVVGGAAAGTLGLEPDRVLGTTVYDYFETTDPTYPPLAAHLRALQGIADGYRFDHGGRVYSVRVGPVRHAIGRVVGVVACATDVTDLLTPSGPSRTVLDALRVPFLRVEAGSRVTFANAAAREAWLQGDPEGRPLAEGGPHFARLAELVAQVWEQGAAASTELSWPSSGGTRLYRWDAALERDPDGSPRAVALLATDVTEAAQAADASRREVDRWERWAAAAADVGSRDHAGAVAEALLDWLCALSGARQGAVRIWDERGQAVAVRCREGMPEPLWERVQSETARGEAVWLDTWAWDDARSLGLPANRFRRVLLVPISGALVAGVACLAWTDDEGQPEMDACPLVRLCRVAGSAASQALAAERAREAQERLALWSRLAASWPASGDPGEAASCLLSTLVDTLGLSGAAVYRRQGALWVRVLNAGDREPASSFPWEEGAARRVVASGRPEVVHPTAGDPAFTGQGSHGILASLSAGLDEAVVALESGPGRGFSGSELSVLEGLLSQLSALLRWARQGAAQAVEARRQRALLEETPVGVLLLDGSRVVRDATGTAAELLGLRAEEVRGRPFAELVYHEDRELAGAELAGLYAEPGRENTWTVRLLRTGLPWWAEVTGRNRISDPQIGGLMLAVRDVTAQRERDEELRRRLAQFQALEEFASALRWARTSEEVGPRVVAQAQRRLEAEHAALALLGPEGDSFTLAYVHGALDRLAGASFPLEGAYARAMSTAEAVRLDEPTEDPLFGQVVGLGPVLVVPVRARGRVLGALGVARRSGASSFSDGDVQLLQAFAEMSADVLERAEVVDALERAYTEVVLSLARAMDAHDAGGAGHGSVVAHWAEAVARRMGCPLEQVREVRWAALLHNVGKVAIPEEILRKPGPLSADELALVQRYPVIGEQILEAVPRFRGVARLVRHHRERWDGTGYPDGLRGEEIPLGSRIIAVVDAYNAMTDHRRYRVARGHTEAVAELQRHAGSQFDPHVVQAFLELLEESRAL
jgi:PAS domain S-box-containing protein